MNDLVDIYVTFELRAPHITEKMIDDCCAISALKGIRSVKIKDAVYSELLMLEKECRILLTDFETLESDILRLYHTLQQQADMCTLFMHYFELEEAPHTAIEGYKGLINVYTRTNTMPMRQRLRMYKNALDRLCQERYSCEECPLYRKEEDMCSIDYESSGFGDSDTEC